MDEEKSANMTYFSGPRKPRFLSSSSPSILFMAFSENQKRSDIRSLEGPSLRNTGLLIYLSILYISSQAQMPPASSCRIYLAN